MTQRAGIPLEARAGHDSAPCPSQRGISLPTASEEMQGRGQEQRQLEGTRTDAPQAASQGTRLSLLDSHGTSHTTRWWSLEEASFICFKSDN